MTFRDRQGKEITITLDLSSNERRTHFDLNGRATNVFPATASSATNEDGLIPKVFWAEESRIRERKILEKVYDIAEREEDVSDIVCDQAYTGTATRFIRERLGIDPSRSRVLYIIIMISHKLEPITELCEDTFLRAWWETVKCHLILWKNGVHHRDISPSNLMYQRVNGKTFGALIDFDLASIGDVPTTSRTERTGTVPFMALDLLEEDGLTGKIPHAYEHDAESFIWVLIFITLRYENGTLRKTLAGRPLDEWLKADATTCRKEKCDCLMGRQRPRRLASGRLAPQAGGGHERNGKLAHQCLNALAGKQLAAVVADLKGPLLDVDSAFQRLLADNVEEFLAPPKMK